MLGTVSPSPRLNHPSNRHFDMIILINKWYCFHQDHKMMGGRLGSGTGGENNWRETNWLTKKMWKKKHTRTELMMAPLSYDELSIGKEKKKQPQHLDLFGDEDVVLRVFFFVAELLFSLPARTLHWGLVLVLSKCCSWKNVSMTKSERRQDFSYFWKLSRTGCSQVVGRFPSGGWEWYTDSATRKFVTRKFTQWVRFLFFFFLLATKPMHYTWHITRVGHVSPLWSL